MRGIGITAKGGQIKYGEKRGLILNLFLEATKHPYQPFVLILEEIQENSLNELIGDLIYLIELKKRVDLVELIGKRLLLEYENEEKLIEAANSLDPDLNYVTVPYLVSSVTKYRKMIFPANIYVFCTSNYRNDRKIIEDNLLRRFEVIELQPRNEIVKDADVGVFLGELNNSILEQFKDLEVHPDRFLIGHSVWLNVVSAEMFYISFLKVVVDFKEIKEVYWVDFKNIIDRVKKWPFSVDLSKLNSYSEMIKFLQDIAYKEFIKY